jgi:hypothetical protein
MIDLFLRDVGFYDFQWKCKKLQFPNPRTSHPKSILQFYEPCNKIYIFYGFVVVLALLDVHVMPKNRKCILNRRIICSHRSIFCFFHFPSAGFTLRLTRLQPRARKVWGP